MSDGYFYKKNPTDTICWYDDRQSIGGLRFSFDKKTIYNAWSDYPWKLTPEQKAIFDKENPYWADFFSDRQ